jgi:hypothetical protein
MAKPLFIVRSLCCLNGTCQADERTAKPHTAAILVISTGAAQLVPVAERVAKLAGSVVGIEVGAMFN